MDELNIIVNLIKSSQRILVATGAGISTSCGIPDFRSKGGIYENASSLYQLPYPEALFDINYFPSDPQPFFAFTRSVLHQEIAPSFTHTFLVELEEQGKQVKILTQNIDRLHLKAGSSDILECHGTFEEAHCFDCHRKYSIDDYQPLLEKDRIPYCDCGGIIKPDIVFFGEQLPDAFYHFWESPPEFDLILILGSSLNVQPFARAVMELAALTTSILVNRDATQYDDEIDFVINEGLDDFFSEITKYFD